MYIKLHEMLDVLSLFPFKLLINDETIIILNKSFIDIMYLYYEVIKVSVGTDMIIVIQIKKYERVTDNSYSFEMGV